MVEISVTAEEHIQGYHAALDVVARERKYLTMLEAFPLAETRDFVLNMIKHRNPHIVATDGDRVVGWCDITRDFFPTHRHCGSLGMGIIPDYRGKGLGRRLIAAALEKARQESFARIELSVHADNGRAIALYEKTGFVVEGVLKRSVYIDGRYLDTICMAVMLDGQ